MMCKYKSDSIRIENTYEMTLFKIIFQICSDLFLLYRKISIKIKLNKISNNC